MTSILNKLVSACETIEANGGSGGESSINKPSLYSCPETKNNYLESPYYIPICKSDVVEGIGRIFITVNNEIFYRYYIEVIYHDNLTSNYPCFKVFKNSSDPDDGTELSFSLFRITISDGTKYIALKISGINTIISETFKICRVAYPYAALPMPGIECTEEEEIMYTEFIPLEAVSSRHQ